jgi:hypothetical protein
VIKTFVSSKYAIKMKGQTGALQTAERSRFSSFREGLEFDAINGGQPFGSIKLSSAPTNITVEPAAELGPALKPLSHDAAAAICVGADTPTPYFPISAGL